jgi:plasmid replication initiation protein
MKPVSKKKDKGIQLIKKSNDLIEARYKFDVWETRVFLFMLSQIRREDGEFHPYRLWYKDMKKVFHVGNNNRSYDHFRTAVKDLMKRQFHVAIEENGFVRETAYQILTKANYLKEGQQDKPGSENQEYIDVSIHPEMKPMLLQLQKNFTAYDLRNVAKLGAHSVRLYELLKQYEVIGKRVLQIEQLKRMLELENEYPNFGQFNQSFVKPAVKDINENTDLDVWQVDQIKEGKKVVSLCFYFKKKSEEDLQKIRAGEQVVRQIRLFTEEQEAEIVEEKSAFLTTYFERLNEWWGVEKQEFFKRGEGKTEKDLETAIAFTKIRIRAGKAENPAGVFLDALSKGHKSIDQFKIEKKQVQLQRELAQKNKLAPLLETYGKWMDEYTQALNDGIREVIQIEPNITENVIEKIKATYQNFGDRTMQLKTVDDFRKDPMLRGMVKSEIMKSDQTRFDAINVRFREKIQETKAQILEIEPGHTFS